MTQYQVDLTEGSSLSMSYDEYFEWYDEFRRGEWVDGRVIVFGRTTLRHQRLIGFFLSLLGYFVETHSLGTVMLGPFEMSIRGGRSRRTPDLLFVANEHTARFDDQRLNGPADLVVEIVSDDSNLRDRQVKLCDYAMGGVSEYWTIDSRSGEEVFRGFRMSSEGHYVKMNAQPDGTYHSIALPGFAVNPDRLAPDSELDFVHALSELGIDILQSAQTRSSEGAMSSPSS